MKVERDLPLLDDILAPWTSTIGADFMGYRNHCARMLNFCFALADLDDEQRRKCTIASAFHDIGIWIGDTVDYIDPSLPPAIEYLNAHGLGAWKDEVVLMITEHHKIRPYEGEYATLVEVFRRADLVDFTLGRVRSGLPAAFVRDVQSAFPNHGFHASLMRRAAGWVLQHPLNPAPMMKW
jgi:hypothetical protein